METLDEVFFERDAAYIENLSNEDFLALVYDRRAYFRRMVKFIHTQALKRGAKATSKEEKAAFRYSSDEVQVRFTIRFGTSDQPDVSHHRPTRFCKPNEVHNPPRLCLQKMLGCIRRGLMAKG